VKSAFPELSAAIALDRVKMAKDAGAKAIVTSCPWCLQGLVECQGDKPEVAVVDLIQLLDNQLRAAKKKSGAHN
jgi:Fe-S oxidoreductase